MSRRAQRVLENSPFFEGFAQNDIAQLATLAKFLRYEAGQEIFAEDELAEQFYVLVSGAVELSFGASWAADAQVTHVQTVSHPGYPLGWSSMVEPYAYRATATARAHTRLLALPRDVLEEHANKNPEFGVALMRAIIGLVGDRVRATRLRLIARRYHDDVTAIQQLLRDSDDVLPLFSPLHKLPHYLENRLTLDDAFHMLDVVRVRGDPAECPVAEVCVDILGNVRRELQLYQQLQAIYSSVADAPADMDPEIVRRRSLAEFQKLFADTTHRILGERLLPERSGHIFIMNHLKNHPDNLLPNNFILTLDTHFVASMILLKKYGDAPIRVVRKAQPDEERAPEVLRPTGLHLHVRRLRRSRPGRSGRHAGGSSTLLLRCGRWIPTPRAEHSHLPRRHEHVHGGVPGAISAGCVRTDLARQPRAAHRSHRSGEFRQEDHPHHNRCRTESAISAFLLRRPR